MSGVQLHPDHSIPDQLCPAPDHSIPEVIGAVHMQNSTGTLELTQPLGPYSTHGKQGIPPTNG